MSDCETAEQFVYISCLEEVLYSFVSHLSEALRCKGINEPYVDCENHFSKEAKAEVERCRVSVMVLPGNCNPSTEYLDKLVQVVDSSKKDDQVVVPVLYGVGTIKGEWRRVLQNISGLSQGHESREECSDSELVKEIVRDVYGKLFSVGRIGVYSKLLEIENMVNRQPLGIRCVGIWGGPGIGKTTLAQAVFDQMYGKFDAYCFIEDYDKVHREMGLYRLLNEQFWDKRPVPGGSTTNLSLPRHKLNKKRVLVVLDDVRDHMLARPFLGGSDWFAPESLIIITSRDKQVFRLSSVNQIYEVHGLDGKEALQHFLLCLSIKDLTEQNLHELSVEVIKYANGNPLALNIYARELKGKKELSGMETAFFKLKQHPPLEIVNAFKSSVDTLSDSEKNIFLDIACFFQGENVDYVTQLLEGCGFFPHVGIDVLVDKGLVTISENRLQMHNMIQDVGREIVNGETIHVERRSRLWEPWSIKYIIEDNEDTENEETTTTFKRPQGTEEIGGMFLDTLGLSFDVKPAAFENMLNLRLLKIYCSNRETHPVINVPKGFLHSLPNELRLLHWENYPLQFLPQNFDPMHLVEINMPYSQLQKLWGGVKNLEMLRTIRLSHSQQLVDIDDLLKAQNLEVIDLQGCTSLQSFPTTGQLLHLRVVNLSGCAEIKSFSEVPPNVEILQLQGTGITELPLSIVRSNYRELVNLLTDIPVLSGVPNVEQTDLERLTSLMSKSSSSQNPGKLICLDLKDCSRLKSLPNMVSLELLNVLDLSGCSDLRTIQGLPRNLKELYLAGTAVREMPQLPQSLEVLNAHGCTSLKSIHLDSNKFPVHYTFSNCFNLSPQVVNLFLEEALANVKHVPRDHQQELNRAPAFSFCAPSHEDHNSALDLLPGSSVMARLDPFWRNTLVGFAMLVEFTFSEDFNGATGFAISCVCRWKDREGRSHKIERNLHFWAPEKAAAKVQEDHVFVFCDVKMRPSTNEGNDPDIWADLVVFEFFPIDKQTKRLDDRCTVKRCGVSAISAATGNSSHKMSSSGSFFDPVEFSGYEVKEVLRVRYDGLEEIDKALFLYIAGLFNDEDFDLVAPLIACIDLDVSSGLKVLANMSLIRVSASGEILMHCLVRQMGKEILHGQSILPRSLKDSIQDIEKGPFAFSSSYNGKYDIFPSFCEQDVCKNFLSHFILSLERRLITTFNNTVIDRSDAIRESNISIVVFSKNYASSCVLLDELVEIATRKRELSQIVIPLFYGIDPSDVKKQTGEFGRQFKQTCKNKTDDEKQRWCRALTDVANILGYISENWDNEADLMETISYDVSNKLNHRGSEDFDDIVGIEGHISKMSSLLCLESKKVIVVGIWGCTGIGKTTIGRTLYGRFAHQFQRSIFVNRCFSNKTMENSWRANLDGYGTKLFLQEQFLSEILGQRHCKVHHLGMIRDRLKDQKVLIILDDVDDIVQLEALIGNSRGFGSGSRIIVISKDEQLLKSHGIGTIYGVDLPSKVQALQMFCRAAFEQNSPPNGFMELAREAVKYSGNLPLDLVTFGSYMRGREKDYWTEIFQRLRYSLVGKIGDRLRVRRESLSAHGNTLPCFSPLPLTSYKSQKWKYHIYPSFYGNDVSRKFLSHFLEAFKHKSIITFKDNEKLISPLHVQEIRDSKILIVVFSKNYASSSLLLNELVEIANCRQELSQKVIPIFYDVDPSEVGRQTGEFGRHFKQTCENKTEEEKQQWRRALIDIANVSGYYSSTWDNEAVMVEKIVNDISNTLGCTPSIGVHVLVGMKAHIAKMDSLLCLESEEVKMVGMWGPSGIGKSTIARALYRQISWKFQQSAFIVISNDYKKRPNMDDYGSMLYFQTLFLSEILNRKDIRADHIGAIKEMLKDQKVLIILDGVDDLFLLDALAGETEWYGSGSRIIVITKDLRLLKSHGINCIYKVELPSKRQALQMLCQSAFRQNTPLYGFMELAVEVVESAGNLPLGLKYFGSYLRGMDKVQWIQMLPRLRRSLDGEIEKVLRVGYDGLCDEDKDLFLHIASLFNHGAVEYVTRLLTGYMDVDCGLTVLAEKSLIHLSEDGNISMHLLVQRLGREIVRRESIPEPGERRFLVDSRDICEVFNEESGTKRVLGISLDIAELDRELSISKRGFCGMRNLRFLKFYTGLGNKEVKKEVNVRISDDLCYLCPKLRLLHWEAFPSRCMPSNFLPENLVELVMEASKLEKLWSEAQPLGSLKFMSLRESLDLREIPDLTYATKLEKLDLAGCSLLKALPSSIRNLHKLRDLDMEGCIKLEVLPTELNLESLYCLNLKGCSQLRSFPDISRNVSDLYLDGTAIEEVPWWVEKISGLAYLSMNGCSKLKKISSNICKLKLLVEVNFSECEALTKDSWQNHPEEISASLMRVNISGNSFRRLPDTWGSIQPKDLIFDNCRNLVSLPVLPASLSMLTATNCESLESLCGSFDYPHAALQFINCFKLNQQARELILQSNCAYAILPGGEFPAYFTDRADGNLLTISLPQRSRSKRLISFKACIMVEPRFSWLYFGAHWSFRGGNGKKHISCLSNTTSTENHLITFGCEFFVNEVSDVRFEFFCVDHKKEIIKIKECGIQLLKVSPSADDSGKRFEVEYVTAYEDRTEDEARSSKRIRIT